MFIAILVVTLIIETILLVKTKLDIYVLSMWIAEKEYPLPNEQDTERLAKKVTDKWFKHQD